MERVSGVCGAFVGATCAPRCSRAVMAARSCVVVPFARKRRARRCELVTMAAEGHSDGERTSLDLLHDAAVQKGSRRPRSKALTRALQAAERDRRSATARSGLRAPEGSYSLLYATGKEKVKRGSGSGQESKAERTASGYFVPAWLVAAGIRFTPDSRHAARGVVENSARSGLIELRFYGRYSWSEAARKLAFNFYRVKLRVGGATLIDRKLVDLQGRSQAEYFEQLEEERKLPFFIFFESNDDFAAARGRGGGLALWKRTSDV
mmetsp:Transcript_7974/g.21130  ORF Transcript_7974/g.21130 Transcript_7974/m.21130 type:complete len:264 (-) Transcript_7974:351-1142(-)